MFRYFTRLTGAFALFGVSDGLQLSRLIYGTDDHSLAKQCAVSSEGRPIEHGTKLDVGFLRHQCHASSCQKSGTENNVVNIRSWFAHDSAEDWAY